MPEHPGPFIAHGDHILFDLPDAEPYPIATAILPGLAHTLTYAANVGLATMGQVLADRMIAGILGTPE